MEKGVCKGEKNNRRIIPRQVSFIVFFDHERSRVITRGVSEVSHIRILVQYRTAFLTKVSVGGTLAPKRRILRALELCHLHC